MALHLLVVPHDHDGVQHQHQEAGAVGQSYYTHHAPETHHQSYQLQTAELREGHPNQCRTDGLLWTTMLTDPLLEFVAEETADVH